MNQNKWKGFLDNYLDDVPRFLLKCGLLNDNCEIECNDKNINPKSKLPEVFL